ncbi:MAG TPA: hypothetical protein VMK82_00665 [Steroidobacteraceae bacterium]|nr:hypothetical protein [Steroidobacteraceae bacterium]
MTARGLHTLKAGVGLGVSLLVSHDAALAAQWSVQPGVQVRALAETNARLVPAGHPGNIDAQAIAAAADLTLQRSTELATLELMAGASQRRYEQDAALDRLDADVGAILRGSRERWSWQARTNAARDTTLTSEAGTSGLTDSEQRHETAGGSFTLSWSASERLALNLGAAVQFDFYPGQQAALVDYRYRSAQLGGSYQLSPRSTLAVTASHGELAASGTTHESRDSAVLVQYEVRPAERFSLTLSAGPSRVEGAQSREHGASYSAALSRGGERLTTTLSAGRRIAPTGRGYLTRRDDATLRFTLRLRERLSVNAGAAYIRSKDVLAGLGLRLNSARYRSASAGMDWQIAERWSLAFSGGHVDQITNATGQHASGFNAQLGVSWRGGAHVW